MPDMGKTNNIGGETRHIPVLIKPVLAALQAVPGKIIVDGTFGAGGYTTAILEQGANVVAIDRDPDAIAAGAALVKRYSPKLRLEHGPFSDMEQLVGQQVDGVVLDVGVSSMQLNEAERGFSFRFDGPLDMRMAQVGLSAADVVNRFKVSDLTRIFGMLGEERHAGRIARAVERVRAERDFTTTSDLAELVEKTIGRKPGDKIHPATRVFQALRIFVNDELGELARALFAAERMLKPGGILAVVTFHSLEDRIVKRFLSERAGGKGGSRHLPETMTTAATFRKPAKAVEPDTEEVAQNPRARSARLRVAERTDLPAGRDDMSIFAMPALSLTGESGGGR